MSEVLQRISNNINLALKISFEQNKLSVEQIPQAQFAKTAKEFIRDSTSEKDINVDEADLAIFAQQRTIKFFVIEIDEWLNYEDFSQKIDQIAQYLNPAQEYLCSVQVGDNFELKQVYYILDAITNNAPEDGDVIFGTNYIEDYQGLKMWLVAGD